MNFYPMATILTSTAYFPPIRYMAACYQAESIIIEINDTYQRQTCRNHCQLSGPNGILQLTVPVKRINGNHTKTKDIRLSGDLPWQKIHWKAICSAYNKSPFFLYYQDLFTPVFEKGFDFLLDLNMEILDILMMVIRSEKVISLTGEYRKYPGEEKDLRIVLVSKHQQDFNIPRYIQSFESHNGFITNLSFLDLLFHQGPETSVYLSKIIPFS